MGAVNFSSASVFSKNSVRPWVVAFALIILSSVLEYAGLASWLRTGVELTTQPVRKASVNVVHVLRQPLEFFRISQLKYTYVLDLELRYAEASSQLSELDHLRQENAELRGELEREKATPSAGVVPGRRFTSIVSYAQPTIALGSDDGLHGGEVVRVGGTFIGRITQLSAHQAEVRLLHTATEEDPVLGQIDQGVSGLVTGNGSDVIMKEVPIETTVQVGQSVKTMGQFGVPAGLLIGRVEQVIRGEGAPTQTIVIDQGVSFFRTTLVEVLE